MDSGFLERLFPGQTTDSFLVKHWPDQHLVSHGPLERLGALGELPELAHLETLLSSFRDKVRIALPDKRDEHSSLQVDALTAAALHRSGMALILNGVDRFLPLVADWLTELRLELGLPLECEPRSIVYATPAGAGNSPHFDANANFVVQLRGTKRWHLAPNHHVPHPTDRWAMNETGLSAELAGYVDAPLPTQMPTDTEVIDLEPGSVLFVPRGYWHATEADEETLAINFTFGQPTWADLVLVALRKRLLRDGEWRVLANDPSRVAEMLARLQSEVERLELPEVLEALDAAPTYLLVPEGFLRVEDAKVLASLGAEAFEIEADEHLHPVLAWIGEQRSPFSAQNAALNFPELATGLPGLLAALESKGLLTRQRP
jgi:50S ribosomal protein L16 3-hydroxylase